VAFVLGLGGLLGVGYRCSQIGSPANDPKRTDALFCGLLVGDFVTVGGAIGSSDPNTKSSCRGAFIMHRIVGIVFVSALEAHKCLAPTASLDVRVAEIPRALGAFPSSFMQTSSCRAFHGSTPLCTISAKHFVLTNGSVHSRPGKISGPSQALAFKRKTTAAPLDATREPWPKEGHHASHRSYFFVVLLSTVVCDCGH
jgi:hypothetical protein